MITKNNQLITAKITSKNQVTIPKIVRQKLGVHSHDELAFQFQEDGSVLVKKNPQVNDFWGQVAEQMEKYSLDEEQEVDWGEDVGNEVID